MSNFAVIRVELPRILRDTSILESKNIQCAIELHRDFPDAIPAIFPLQPSFALSHLGTNRPRRATAMPETQPLVHPAWSPLDRALPPDQAAAFRFLGTKDGIFHYRHTGSQQVLHLDHTGRVFYRALPDGGYRPIPREDALDKVGLVLTPRCPVCDGTKLIVETRPMAIYQGKPTRVVTGRCTRCDAHGRMLPARADRQTEAAHAV